MQYYLVAVLGVIRAEEFAFTYSSSSPIDAGTIVRVPVGKRVITGVALRPVNKPAFTTKPIDAVLLPTPLPTAFVKLALWLSEYYATHGGLVLQAMLPSGLQKTRRTTEIKPHPIRNRVHIVLNKDQAAALELINQAAGKTVLLHGVTGSGKTQVYIEAAKAQAEQGKSSIILVPEIALTPQLVAEFTHHFERLIITHSGLSEAKRHLAWVEALQATEPTVVIGPRSALFMPLKNVGLVVVDECHEPSYKQEQSPRYLALRAASVLARAHNAALVLGSATPSVADYYVAQSQNATIASLSKPATPKKTKVETTVVDYKNRAEFRKHRFISNTLITKITETLANNQQVLLFHNRRGTAPTTICTSCGWTAECPHCFLPLTLHADRHELLCHLCGTKQTIPPGCPTCKEPTVAFKGIGTKMIEAEVAKLFPKARVARFDADTKQEDMLHNRYQDLYDGNIDILIGTQIVAKGLDLPKLATVGVVQADSGLILPDFQAEERVFQLIYQVIGRVGRGQLDGHVVVQTFQPEHPALTHAINRDYAAFYEQAIKQRAAGRFPPFRFLLKLVCTYKTEKGAITASQKLAVQLRQQKDIEILGPTPAFHERFGGNFRWQIIVASKKRQALVAIAKNLPQHWQFDIDPASLL